jgi:RNA polymerase sigma-70 factor (ECF subfamily)
MAPPAHAFSSPASQRNCRALIPAAFLDRLSYPELAAREQVPLPTMKSWIRRSLIRLRLCLER